MNHTITISMFSQQISSLKITNMFNLKIKISLDHNEWLFSLFAIINKLLCQTDPLLKISYSLQIAMLVMHLTVFPSFKEITSVLSKKKKKKLLLVLKNPILLFNFLFNFIILTLNIKHYIWYHIFMNLISICIVNQL